MVGWWAMGASKSESRDPLDHAACRACSGRRGALEGSDGSEGVGGGGAVVEAVRPAGGDWELRGPGAAGGVGLVEAGRGR